MKTKEKAKELVEKFENTTHPISRIKVDGTKCALICVELMIHNAKENFKLAQELKHKQSEGLMAGELLGLNNLKKEIEKL